MGEMDRMDIKRNRMCDTDRLFKGLATIATILTLLLSACDISDKADLSQNKASEDYIQRESVAIEQPVSDPLAQAMQLIGLTPANLVRPRYLEEDYQMQGRNPLIDRVGQSPFYLHHWADSVSSQIQQSTSNGLYPALSTVIQTLNGGVVYDTTADAQFNGGCRASIPSCVRAKRACAGQNRFKQDFPGRFFGGV